MLILISDIDADGNPARPSCIGVSKKGRRDNISTHKSTRYAVRPSCIVPNRLTISSAQRWDESLKIGGCLHVLDPTLTFVVTITSSVLGSSCFSCTSVPDAYRKLRTSGEETIEIECLFLLCFTGSLEVSGGSTYAYSAGWFHFLEGENRPAEVVGVGPRQ